MRVLLNNPLSRSGSGPSGDEPAAMLREEGAVDVAVAGRGPRDPRSDADHGRARALEVVVP